MAEETSLQVTIDNSQITFNTGDCVSLPSEPYPRRRANPTTVDNVERGTLRLIVSQTYLQTKQKVEGKRIAVVHLQGMPGTGKSEIALRLGHDFPYASGCPVAKWQIECDDDSDTIQSQFKIFLEQMVKNDIVIVETGAAHTAVDNLMNDRCQQFVNILADCQFPILIIIEEPTKKDRKLLHNFLSCVGCIEGRVPVLHIYVTSTSKKTCDIPMAEHFYFVEVNGFTQEEGLEFLRGSRTWSQDEKEAAIRILERLSYSPLGLVAVKATDPNSYEMYLEHLENDSLHSMILANESKKMKDAGQMHVYEAILYLLKPTNAQNEELQRLWTAIRCMAFFHHRNVPKILVCRVMQYMRDEEQDMNQCHYLNEIQTKEFVEKFCDYGMCKISADKAYVSFHEVVFRAVNCFENDQCQLFYSVGIKALASIVHKDLRQRKNTNFMHEMHSHMISILKRQPAKPTSILTTLCRAHISEVAGVVMGTKEMFWDGPSEAERNLNEALRILLEVVSDSDLTPEFVTECLSNDIAQKKAALILKRLTQAANIFFSKKLDIETFISIVFHPKEDNMHYYANHSDQEVADYFNDSLTKQTTLQPQKLREFRKRNVILLLEDKTLRKTYLVERVASILHSLSRLVTYKKNEVTSEEKIRYEWFSKLCLAICDEVRKRFKIAPLFLRINATSLASIKLKSLKTLPAEQKRAHLLETKEFVEQNLLSRESCSTLLYEHGILIKLAQDEFDVLRHKGLIVRINTKLRPRDDSDNQRDDDVCKVLQDLARNNREWVASNISLIYCGKYWAAKKDYGQALELFEMALQCAEFKTPVEIVKLFPWGCYNHARAVVGGKISHRVAESKAHCEEALQHRNQIANDLVDKLIDYLSHLNQIL